MHDTPLVVLLFCLQEMLLKRAADLVEALYGTPHNNQVRAPLFFIPGMCKEGVVLAASPESPFHLTYLSGTDEA